MDCRVCVWGEGGSYEGLGGDGFGVSGGAVDVWTCVLAWHWKMRGEGCYRVKSRKTLSLEA